MAERTQPHPDPRAPRIRGDRPRALAIAGDEAGPRIEAALAPDLHVLHAAALARAAAPGEPIDVIVLDSSAAGFGADSDSIAALAATLAAPLLVVADRSRDADAARWLRAGAADRATPDAPEELRARALVLATLKRTRDALQEGAPPPAGDLDELARRAAVERRAADEARREAESTSRAKDEFLAVLAHELRTPLNAVMGWTTLLRRGGLSEADARRGLEVIERNARAQARLIEDVLEVSAMVLRKVRVKLDPIALGPVLSEALDAIRPAADTKGIELDWTSPDRELTVLGDAERLVQVIHNLVGNAVKFTAAGGRVAVRVDVAGDAVVLEVIDTGVGIAPDFLPHVFNQYAQAANRPTDRARGLGLGLAIARHLVELHGGRIEAASAGEGQGATFTVRLPLLHAPNPAAPATLA